MQLGKVGAIAGSILAMTSSAAVGEYLRARGRISGSRRRGKHCNEGENQAQENCKHNSPERS